MSDKPAIGPLSRRAMLLVAGIGLGGAMAGCADIHPEGNNPDGGIMDAPTDEAVRDREASERETEHGDEEQRNR
jgi:hypothetical protein